MLDLETTGTLPNKDKIIEVSAVLIAINKNSGHYEGIVDEYYSLNDPGFPIPEEATAVNGITDTMVENKKMDIRRLDELADNSDLLDSNITPNLTEAFWIGYYPSQKRSLGGCSMLDIDWGSKGFDSKALGVLGIYHGFHFNSLQSNG